jgi:hypothetical protein
MPLPLPDATVMSPRKPSPTRYPLPADSALMARLRLPDTQRLLLGGGSEDSDQRRLATYLNGLGILWEHPTNEGERDGKASGAAIARGLKKGSPDIRIYKPFCLIEHAIPTRCAGLAIELKRSDATPCAVTDEQRWWLDELRKCGWVAEWCRGYAEAISLVRACYGEATRAASTIQPFAQV